MSRTKKVLEFGQCFWQDYIERSELKNGKLERLINEDGLHGITSNPTIFHKAITGTKDYDGQIKQLAASGKTISEIFQRVTVDDIKDACRIMGKVYRETGGSDGFVSIEVNPQLAYDTAGTIAEARGYFSAINQPNLMVKVPGTDPGMPAVRTLIGEGINVNVTLLFSPEYYEKAAQAYIEGLEIAAENGQDLSKINSVASFFLSRIDTQVDKQLDTLLAGGKIDSAKHKSLRGETAIAVAKITYKRFKQLFFENPRYDALKKQGAKLQRPLWASTGTKDKAYSDVKYVEPLIGPHTVNTLPPATLDAFRDHGVAAHTLENVLEQAPEKLAAVEAVGIDMKKIFQELQSDGVNLFIKSYTDLLQALEEKARKLRG
ncbi:MAG: transaldolase [Candidatus Schekmanbacteria bacterium]|nr:transaldolase [Candidatus Schekmanbacteria bacterium]